MNTPNRKLIRKWIAALRSGEYKQHIDAQQQADIERLRKVEQRADELLKALDAKFPMPVRHHDVNAQTFNLRAVLKLTENKA